MLRATCAKAALDLAAALGFTPAAKKASQQAFCLSCFVCTLLCLFLGGYWIPSSSLLSCMPLSESQSVYYVVFSYGVNPRAAAKFEAAFAHATGNTKRPISRGCQTLLWRRRSQRIEQKSGESFFPLLFSLFGLSA